MYISKDRNDPLPLAVRQGRSDAEMPKKQKKNEISVCMYWNGKQFAEWQKTIHGKNHAAYDRVDSLVMDIAGGDAKDTKGANLRTHIIELSDPKWQWEDEVRIHPPLLQAKPEED
jgi:hypothetical protein